MKLLKKILTIATVTVMMTAIFAVNAKKATSISKNFSERQPIKVGSVFKRAD